MEELEKMAAFQAMDRVGATLGGNRSQINAPPELRSAIDRASEIYKNLSGVSEILGSHLDRILGSVPEAGEASGLAGVDPDSEISALRIELSNLDTLGYRIRTQVERLARL